MQVQPAVFRAACLVPVAHYHVPGHICSENARYVTLLYVQQHFSCKHGLRRAVLYADVQFMPFHVKSTSLPELTASQWDSLIQSGNASEDSRNNVAAVLMSEPHFIQVRKQPGGTILI